MFARIGLLQQSIRWPSRYMIDGASRLTESGMAMTDSEKILRAVRKAQLILSRYIEPGNSRIDREQTINDLLSILDRSDLVEAADRLEAQLGLRIPY